MPFDRTIQVIVKPATHTLTNQAKNASRYATGDPVAVLDTAQYAVWNGTTSEYEMQSQMGNSKFVFIHVTSIPDTVTINTTLYNFTADIFDAVVLSSVEEYVNQEATVATVTGSFANGDPLTFSPSGATGTFELLESNQMRFAITSEIQPAAGDTIEGINAGVDQAFLVSLGIVNNKMIRRRGMRFKPSKIPLAAKIKLRNDREITVTWLQFRSYVRKKLVVNSQDASIDGEGATRGLTTTIGELETLIAGMQ